MYSRSIPFLVYAVLYTVYFFPCMILFLWRRKKEPIHSRGWELAVVSAVGGYIQFLIISLETMITQNPETSISCHFLFWPTTIFVPVFGLPYFLRSVILYTKYRFNISKMLDTPQEMWLTRNKFVSNPIFSLLIMLVSILVTIIIDAATTFYPGAFFPPTSRYYCLDPFLYFMVAQVVVMIVLYIIASVKTWGMNDAFEIKTELKVLIIIVPVLFIPLVIRTATTWLTPYVDQAYFSLPIILIAFTASIVYPVIISYKLERSRFDTVTVASSQAEMKNIVNNLDSLFRFVMESEIMRKEFQQFCIDAWCIENYLFYKDVYEYQSMESPEERKETAQRIIELYIGESAPRQVNIDVHAEKAIRQFQAKNDFEPDMFKTAMAQVEQQMKQDTLSHWKQTQSFRTSLERARTSEEKPRASRFSMHVGEKRSQSSILIEVDMSKL